jgi:hypothetical protein
MCLLSCCLAKLGRGTQQGDLLSFSFFQNRESRLKNGVCISVALGERSPEKLLIYHYMHGFASKLVYFPSPSSVLVKVKRKGKEE